MVKINLRKDEIILCVLDYLKQSGLIATMRALEHETGITTTNYGTDLTFLRGLILDAQFDDAESFVVPLANVDNFDADRVLFEIRRQRFLELVDGNEGEAAQHVLSTSLKQLESKCSRAEWHKLCYCLTLQSLADHPDYTNWTPYRGRMDCFESLRREFDRALSNQWTEQKEKIQKLNPNHLVTLLQQSALYQASSYLAENSNRSLPNPMFFDLLSPTFVPLDANGKPAGPQGRSNRFDILGTDVMRRAQNQMGFDSRSDGQLSDLGSKQYPIPDVTVVGGDNPRKTMSSQMMRSSWAGSGGGGLPMSRRMKVSEAPPVTSMHSSIPLEPKVIKKPVSWEVPLGIDEMPVDPVVAEEEGVRREGERKENEKIETSKVEEKKIDEKVQENKESQPLPPSSTTTTNPQADDPTKTSLSRKKQVNLTTSSNHSDTKYGDTSKEPDSSSFHDYRVFSEIVASHAIRAVSISPDGTRIAIGTNGRHLQVVATPMLEQARKVHSLTIEEGGEEGKKIENDNNSSILIKPRILTEHSKLHLGSVYDVAWSDDSRMLATCSNDMMVKAMKIRHDYHNFPPNYDEDNTNERDVELSPVTFRGHDGTIRTLCFANGNQIVSGGAGDCHLRVWDPLHQTDGDGPLLSLKGHQGSIFSVQSGCASNGTSVLNPNTVVSGSEDKTIRVWDLRSGSCVANIGANGVSHWEDGTPAMAKCPVQSLAVCPQSDATVVTGHEDGNCCVWDLKTSKLLWMLRTHETQCRSVAYSNYGRYILSASFDGSLAVSDGDIWERRVVTRLRGHSGKVLRAQWHPTNNIFVSSSTDCTVKLWGSLKN
jgi:WD40 repeat protein